MNLKLPSGKAPSPPTFPVDTLPVEHISSGITTPPIRGQHKGATSCQASEHNSERSKRTKDNKNSSSSSGKKKVTLSFEATSEIEVVIRPTEMASSTADGVGSGGSGRGGGGGGGGGGVMGCEAENVMEDEEEDGFPHSSSQQPLASVATIEGTMQGRRIEKLKMIALEGKNDGNLQIETRGNSVTRQRTQRLLVRIC